MYDHILIPTDGSEHSRAATRRALDLAQQYDATVHAIYVIDIETSWLTVSRAKVHDTLRDVGEAEGKQALTDVEEIAAETSVDLTTTLLEGTPEDEILDYVTEHDIDLVVMGTHGRSGVGRHLIGSVAERVVRQSPVPVMTVQAEETETAQNREPQSH